MRTCRSRLVDKLSFAEEEDIGVFPVVWLAVVIVSSAASAASRPAFNNHWHILRSLRKRAIYNRSTVLPHRWTEYHLECCYSSVLHMRISPSAENRFEEKELVIQIIWTQCSVAEWRAAPCFRLKCYQSTTLLSWFDSSYTFSSNPNEAHTLLSRAWPIQLTLYCFLNYRSKPFLGFDVTVIFSWNLPTTYVPYKACKFVSSNLMSCFTSKTGILISRIHQLLY